MSTAKILSTCSLVLSISLTSVRMIDTIFLNKLTSAGNLSDTKSTLNLKKSKQSPKASWQADNFTDLSKNSKDFIDVIKTESIIVSVS